MKKIFLWLFVVNFLLLSHFTFALNSREQSTTNLSSQLRWFFVESADYEQQYPGYGQSFSYQTKYGLADVYIYDLNKKDWLKGIADPQILLAFHDSLSQIKYMASQGTYRHFRTDQIKIITISNQLFYQLFMSYDLESKQHMKSYLFMTAFNGKLLKFRISFSPQVVSFDTQQAAVNFIQAQLRRMDTQHQPIIVE